MSAPPPLQVLWPADAAGELIAADPSEARLAELYAYPEARWVRSNMVATVDGAAAGDDGRSGSVSTPADRRVFRLLRSLADVVLVGAGTVRAERYGPPRVREELAARRAAAGQEPAPRLAVVTRTGDVPDDLGLLDGDRPALVVTCEAAGAVAGRLRTRLGRDGVLVAGDADVDLGVTLDVLAERGLTRVLCEGGPTLLGHLAAAGRLDELCLTTSPTLIGGDGPRVLHGPTSEVPLRLAHLLHDPGTLLARWVRA